MLDKCGKAQSRRQSDESRLMFKIYKKMNIKKILNTNPNTLLVISAADLKEFAIELMDECNNSSKSGNRSDKYLTITETEKKYGISKTTLWRWSKDGYLPKVKLGGKCYYRETDITKLMEGGLV